MANLGNIGMLAPGPMFAGAVGSELPVEYDVPVLTLTAAAPAPEYSPHIFYPGTLALTLTTPAPAARGGVFIPYRLSTNLDLKAPAFDPVTKVVPVLALNAAALTPKYGPVTKFPPALSLAVALQAPMVVPIIMPPPVALTLTVPDVAMLASVDVGTISLTASLYVPFYIGYKLDGSTYALVPDTAGDGFIAMEIPTTGSEEAPGPEVAGAVTLQYGLSGSASAILPETASGDTILVYKLVGDV